MLNGKKLNVLHVWMQLIAEIVIQSVLTDGKCQNAEDLMRALNQIANQSRTARPTVCAHCAAGLIYLF